MYRIVGTGFAAREAKQLASRHAVVAMIQTSRTTAQCSRSPRKGRRRSHQASHQKIPQSTQATPVLSLSHGKLHEVYTPIPNYLPCDSLLSGAAASGDEIALLHKA